MGKRSRTREERAIYQLRRGTGIGVFAPQFGPLPGFFFGLSKQL